MGKYNNIEKDIDNQNDSDFVSTTTGFLGGLKYTKLLNGKKNRWKTLISEVKKYDPKNPVIKAILKTISLAFYIPLYFIAKLKGTPEKYTYKITSNWGKSLIKIANIELEIIGEFKLPENRAIIFISNHTSPYDIPIIYGSLPVLAGFISNKEISKMPVMNFWMRKAHSIFVDIYDPKSKVNTLRKIVNNLNKKQNLIIFPEGKMSPDGNLQEFQRGSFKAAEISEAIIAPIALIGVRNVILPGSFTLNSNQKVRFCIGEPIDVLKLSKSQKNDLSKIAFDSINAMIKRYSF